MTIQESLLLFSLLFFALGIVLSTMLIVIEYRWTGRALISYSNYGKQKKYFKVKTDYRLIISVAIYTIISLILVYIVYAYPAIQFLTYLLFIGMFINLITILLYASHEKHNKDLSFFDTYYQDLKSNYENQSVLEKNIKNHEKTYADLLAKVSENELFIEARINHTIPYPNFKQSLKPFKDKIDEAYQYLNNFDKSMSNEFDRVLHSYLKMGALGQAKNFTFSYDINQGIEQSVKDSATLFTEMIADYIIQSYKMDSIKSNRDLIELLDFMNRKNYKFEKDFIVHTLRYLETHTVDRRIILDYLIDNYDFSMEVIQKYIIEPDNPWFFESQILTKLDQQSLIMMLNHMVTFNASKSAMTLLTANTGLKLSAIKHMVSQIQTHNDTLKAFEMYLLLQEHKTSYNDTAIGIEHKTLALKHYFDLYESKHDNLKILNHILKNGTFEEREDEINDAYTKLTNKFVALYTTSNELLYLWHNSSAKDVMIDSQQAISLLGDFQKNFSIQELVSLSLLLGAFILEKEQSHDKIDRALFCIKKILLDRKMNIIASNIMTFKNKEKVSKSIISYLTQDQNIKSLKKVVNRVETDRLMLNNLKLMAGTAS